MVLYALNMIQPAGEERPSAREEVRAELGVLRRDLEAQEAWVFGKPLLGPEASTMVRLKGDDVVASDGPWRDGGEFIGGLVIIEAGDLDAALKVAARYTCVTGLPVEVRPFQS